MKAKDLPNEQLLHSIPQIGSSKGIITSLGSPYLVQLGTFTRVTPLVT